MKLQLNPKTINHFRNMLRHSPLLFDATKIRKRSISKHQTSLFVKILTISLFLNGICIYRSNTLRYLMATTYHIAWILSVTKSVTCIITNTYLIDLYSGNLIVHILAIVLWWILFSRRNKMYRFVLRLSPKHATLQIKTKVLAVFLMIILFPPFVLYTDMVTRIVVNDEDNKLGPRPCRYFKHSKSTYLKHFFQTLDIIRPYISYSIFFLVVLTFFMSGCLTWRKFQRIEKRIDSPSQDILSAWRTFKSTVLIVKELEATMSLPVFFLLCKIAVDTFNGVSALCSGETAEYARYVFILTVPQETAWLLSVVVLGDLIQKLCLKIMNVGFSRLRSSPSVRLDFNYLDYKNMKAGTVLTAGNMFKLNRGLLLKALTSSITYAVIITQLKDY